MQDIFESGELTNLVGIKPFFLNKFMERSLYGIRPSIRQGKVRERRRLFNREDVFGVALVWWLFESGLRSPAVQFVLNQIDRCRAAKANSAARKLLAQKAQFLVVRREPRSTKDQGAKHPKQGVQVADRSQVVRMITAESAASMLVIPVGKLYSALTKRIGAS